MVNVRNALTAALSALLIGSTLQGSGLLYSLNEDIRDYLFSANMASASSDLVLVEIDAISIKQLDAWPWPRSYYATLIDRLSDAGASKIAIDLDLSTPSIDTQDRILADAIGKHSAAHEIILPVFYQRIKSRAGSPELMTRPLDLFLQAGAQMASVNVSPDTDGLVRRVERYPNIALPSLPSYALALSRDQTQTRQPITLDFSIHPDSFQRISFATIMRGEFDPEQIRGKPVLIGSTAAELGDQLAVPLHQALPGMVVQALAYQSLQQRPLGNLKFTEIILLLAIVALIVAVVTRNISWRGGILVLCVAIAGILALTLLIYSQWRIFLPAYSLVITAIASLAANFILTIDQQGLTLRRQRNAIQAKDEVVRAVFHNSRDPIITLTAGYLISEVNGPAVAMIGIPRKELLGAPIATRLPAWNAVLSDTAAAYIETCLIDHQGEKIPVEISHGGAHVGNAEGHILIFRDITERLKLQAMLEFAASHDTLTKLPNRRALQNVMEQHISQALSNQTHAAVLLLDLNHFKEINDTLGHATGDIVLQQLSERITECLPENVTAARIGGDEFACVTSGADAKSRLESFAVLLLENLLTPFHLDDMSIHLSASAGISVFPDDASCAAELLQHADVAMYRAKMLGKPVSIYDQATNQHCIRRLSIINQLRDAIHSDSLQVYYQPKVDAKTNICTGAEALVRWLHPQLGFISPAEFIPLAEQTGNIDLLTQWVVNRVFSDINDNSAVFSCLRVSINISGKSLADAECAHGFLRNLEKAGVSSERVSIEVTESAAMENPERAVEILGIFRSAGIEVELDDYGTGYSSLSYLQRLPVDVIKLDRSLIKDVTCSKTSYTIVSATIDMIHKLGYSLVAEGVEDLATLELLSAMGCEKIQGFYFSKPLPINAFNEWFCEHNTAARHIENRKWSM